MLLTIVTFLIILGLIVLVHELGHFLTARFFGVKVEEFGFGFPPRLVGFYKNKEGRKKIVWGNKFKAETAPTTVYSLNQLPIGGFVKIKGEDGIGAEEADSFAAKRSWKKGIILAAGVLGNFILCFVLFTFGFIVGLPTIIDDEALRNVRNIRENQIQIISVNAGSPAELAGLKIGDAIIALDGQTLTEIAAIQTYTAQKENQLVEIKIERGGKKMDLKVVPKILATSENKAVMGVGLARTAIVAYRWYEAIWQGLKNTGLMAYSIVLALILLVKNIILTGQVSADLAGPVGMAVLTGQVTQLGWIYVLQFTALLSLNLGIINILPIPALDGGRLLFVLIERIRGKKINQKIENTIHSIGFAFLMILVLLVTYRDIVRWGGQIIDKII